MPVLEGTIGKPYAARQGGRAAEALKGVGFAVERGEFVAHMGESGSGKTRLLNPLPAMDRPFRPSGKSSRPSSAGNPRALSFRTISPPDLFTLRGNLCLPLVLSGISPKEMLRRIGPTARRPATSALPSR